MQTFPNSVTKKCTWLICDRLIFKIYQIIDTGLFIPFISMNTIYFSLWYQMHKNVWYRYIALFTLIRFPTMPTIKSMLCHTVNLPTNVLLCLKRTRNLNMYLYCDFRHIYIFKVCVSVLSNLRDKFTKFHIIHSKDSRTVLDVAMRDIQWNLHILSIQRKEAKSNSLFFGRFAWMQALSINSSNHK